MKKFIITFAALAAAITPAVGREAYRFEQPSFVHTDIRVIIVPMQTTRKLMEEAARLGAVVDPSRKISAFSIISPTMNQCTIYMVEPKNGLNTSLIGHELLHCIYGDWHPNQP